MLNDLTAEFLKDRFTYDPSEGLLRYRREISIKNRIEPAGTIAGAPNKEGYRYIKIDKRSYRASRLIWLYMTGEWPKHQVDHIDQSVANDKWENLREATGSQNKANNGKYRRENVSCPLKGVQAVQKRKSIRYRAIATKDGQRFHLGYFDTPELAHAAYLRASEELHGEFASDGMRK